MPPTRVPASVRSKDEERRRPNTLFHGENWEILIRYIEDDSVDLVYLDPPFQSGRDYNLLFKREDGTRPEALKTVFTDTWHWDAAAAAAYSSVLSTGGRVADVLESMQRLLENTPMLAYMSMMAIRLIELRRVLKPTGSLYLHCDSTASHYLRLVLDSIFGTENFRNEIVWKRTTAKSLMYRKLPNNHDIIFLYSKGEHYTWNQPFDPYDHDNLDDKTASKYCHADPDGRRYTLGDLTNPNRDRPNLTYEFMGHTKVWRWTRERMKAALAAGIVVQPSPGAVPRLKRYLDEREGRPIDDVWEDIPPLNSQAKERLGYPTQKPVALLRRIIEASSNEGDLVLDPFCGCGTTIHAAQEAHRKWIGIDIAKEAIEIIQDRIRKYFGDVGVVCYETIREPKDEDGARALALQDRHQFEKWAVRLVGGDSDDKAKGADRGIDGILQFQEAPGAPIKKIIISVKSGHTSVRDVRDLAGTVGRENAAMGVLIVLNKPTAPMRAEASSAGLYFTRHSNQPERFQKIQILTVEELLEGEMIKAPINFRRRGPKRASPQIELKFPTFAKAT